MYKIVYSKFGNPLSAFVTDRERAEDLVQRLRRSGYAVTVWICNGISATKTNL